MINSCIDCQDRYIGCHAECNRYIQAKAEYEAEQAVLSAEKNKANDLMNFACGRTERHKRSHKTRVYG